LSSHTHITVVDLIFHQDEIDAIHREMAIASSHLRIVTGDIRDGAVLDEAMTKDITGVIHLAAVSRVGWCLENEPDCQDVNVRGTDVVLEAIERKGIKAWFVQASSREVYGNAKSFPVSEEAPNIPANAYGRTKSEAEAIIKSHRTPAILLRLSNVFGGLRDHRERLIPAIVSSALSHRTIQMVGGNQDLDMVHIDDVVHAFLLAVAKLEKGGIETIEAYNIGTGTSASAMDIIQKVLALTNSSSPLQIIPGDARFPDHYIGTTSKSATELGFTAQVGVDDGLVRLVSAFYQDTLSFINRQASSSCSPKPAYSAHDLAKLDGCTGTVGVDGKEGMEYLSTETNDNNLRTWKWLDTDEVQMWKFKVKDATSDHAIVSFTQEHSGGEIEFQATQEGHLFGAQSRFEVRVDSISGYISLAFQGSDTSLVPEHLVDHVKSVRYRLTPFCCPGKPAPWPFYEEDPLASAITDTRLGTHRYFNASQTQTLCDKLSAAKTIAQTRLDGLTRISAPFKLELADLPAGQPYQWISRGLDHCTNLCDHPTICLDTGDCACASRACVPRIRYPFTAFANVTGLSYPPPTINWDEVETNDPLILIRKVAQSSWLNVLRPHARRYLQSTPDWPAVHLTSMPDDVQVNRDTNWGDFDKLQSTPHGCFSADSVMERGIKLLNQEYTPESLVFMPYYAGTQMVSLQDRMSTYGQMPPVEPWIDNALTRHLPSDFDPTRLIVPFTFDWGVCNTVLHDLWRVRDWSSVAQQMEKLSSWQPMGDLNSPCE
jgi:nucleoside-diphosphate-sugar epimerase